MSRALGVLLVVAALLLPSCKSPPEGPTAATPAAGTAAAPAEASAETTAAFTEEALPETAEEAGEPDIDPAAVPILHAMADALRSAKTLSFRTESWTDEEVDDGVHASVGAESRVLLRQPDGLFVDRIGEKGHRVARYDGKTFSICDPERKVWARIDAPATVEATLDMLEERFGIVVPLADLFVGDPYEAYTSKAQSIVDLGVRPVKGVSCHHISLSNDWLAWQIWIPVEGPPLPRRVEIRYLDEPGAPRFTAFLDDWKVDVAVSAEDFAFVPPEGSQEIEIKGKAAGAGAADASGRGR